MATKEGLKRAIDLILCLVTLPLVLPVLLVCGVLIKLDSQGPVVFRQQRLGRHHKPFRVVKLRTMVEGAERMGAGFYAEQDDPRYTRLGLLLRRFSLDELPQVFNVLGGTMSIVGPRPLPAEIVEQYQAEYQVILKVRPGITGLSQVSGRNELPRRRRLQLDMHYAENWSLGLDLQILWETVAVVATGTGQVNYQSREDVER
jgi:lipopolysaccharide/colanic/teichoic acid biosynthesis glycosyltransferase